MPRPKVQHTKTTSAALTDIAIAEINMPSVDMREQRTQEHIDKLARSITAQGLLQPITVCPRKKGYEIVFGCSRFLAFQQLGRATIPGFIIKMTKAQMLCARAAENLDRENITPFEESIYVGELLNTLKCTHKKLAKLLSKSDAWVSQRVAIFDYPEDLLQAMRDNKITFSVARELAKVKDGPTMANYLWNAIENGATPRVVSSWVAAWQAAEAAAETSAPDAAPPPIFEPSQVATAECFMCKNKIDYGHARQIWLCIDDVSVLKEITRQLKLESEQPGEVPS